MQVASTSTAPPPIPPDERPPTPTTPTREKIDKEKEEEEEAFKAWDSFAEQYHDIVVELPIEYERNFLLLSELEESQQKATSSLHTSLLAYLSHLRSPPSVTEDEAPSPVDSTTEGYHGPSPRVREMLDEISKWGSKAVRAGEDKVGVAVALYDSVDRQIRSLDTSLAQIEDSLIIGLRAGTLPSHDAPSLSLKSPPGATTSRGAIALGEREAYFDHDEGGGGRGGRRRGRATSEKMAAGNAIKRERRDYGAPGGGGGGLGMGLEEDVVGMAIDPNEPRYCYCNRVSFGEMIACENDNCAREWFHLSCVNMDTAPEGNWWCDECREILGIKAADMGSHNNGGRSRDPLAEGEKKKRKKGKWG